MNSVTPIKTQRSVNSNVDRLTIADNLPKSQVILEDFQNLLSNLSNCKSGSKSHTKHKSSNFIQNLNHVNNFNNGINNLVDQNSNPNNFFSEILSSDLKGGLALGLGADETINLKKNYEIRLAKI